MYTVFELETVAPLRKIWLSPRMFFFVGKIVGHVVVVVVVLAKI